MITQIVAVREGPPVQALPVPGRISTFPSEALRVTLWSCPAVPSMSLLMDRAVAPTALCLVCNVQAHSQWLTESLGNLSLPVQAVMHTLPKCPSEGYRGGRRSLPSEEQLGALPVEAYGWRDSSYLRGQPQGEKEEEARAL